MSPSGTHTASQVLIVGAGPVGLTTAHELARRGVRVRLVDGAAGPTTTSRALATHARTLETYDQMGVLDRLLPRGHRVEHFTLHQNGRPLVRFDTDYSRLPTRFPFTLMVDQSVAEEVLREAVARHGVEVEWGVRLESLTDHGTGVDALLRHEDGRTEEAETDWLVGCDGGHSTVRRQLGLQLVGESSETWLIADAVLDVDLPRDSIHWLRTPAGTVMLVPFPEPGKWRLLDTADVRHESDDQVARRFAEKIRTGTGQDVTVAPPTWVSVFTIQQRMIPSMRSGRCFVAGDAAHVHSPASGQGLNTGVQDAFNLAWKLAEVVHGRARTSLLDSYGEERVPVGAALLSSTRAATALIALRDRRAAAALRAVFTLVKALPWVKSRIQRKIMGAMSALDLAYPDSALTLVGAAGPESAALPAAGGRAVRVTADALAASAGWQALVAELRRPGWLLLSFAPSRRQDAVLRQLVELYSGSLRVRAVLAQQRQGSRLGVILDPDDGLRQGLQGQDGDWLLIRPDGYLAARGTEFARFRVHAALSAAGLIPSSGVPHRTSA